MKKIKINYYGEEKEVEVRKGFYAEPKNLVLALYEEEEVLGIVTVNFSDEILENDRAFLDTNNFPWIEEALKDCGFYLYRNKQSGFCSYPLWVFDPCFLDQCDNMA